MGFTVNSDVGHGARTLKGIAYRAVTDAAFRGPCVGDLLEPGEWIDKPGIADDTTELARRYSDTVEPQLGQCRAGRASQGRVSLCLLSEGHEDWSAGRAHRMYLFSARDSAAMLAGMKRRLANPLEELSR